MTEGGAGADEGTRADAGTVLRRFAWRDMSPLECHAVLRLRCDVFVVEQACAYPDVDGRDVEPGTRHWWLSPVDDSSTVRCYLRLLAEPEGMRIGRVVTAAAARGRGLSRRLLSAVVEDLGGSLLVLDAQSHLVAFYASAGFEVAGEEYVEDGIPHVPMRRQRVTAAQRPPDRG